MTYPSQRSVFSALSVLSVVYSPAAVSRSNRHAS